MGAQGQGRKTLGQWSHSLRISQRVGADGKIWARAAPLTPQMSGPRPEGRQSQTWARRETEGHRQVVADTDPEDRQVGYERQTQRWEREQ